MQKKFFVVRVGVFCWCFAVCCCFCMVFWALLAGGFAHFQCCYAWRLMLSSVVFAYVVGCEDCVEEEGDNRLSPSSTMLGLFLFQMLLTFAWKP